MLTSVFADLEPEVYKNQFTGRMLVGVIAGGVPSDPRVAEGWLRTKLTDKDDDLRDLVAQTMLERGIDMEAATEEVAKLKHLNGFKRDETGLYIEGRNLKAAIKESANIRWPGERWGTTKKGTKSFFAEHVFVVEDRLHLKQLTDGAVPNKRSKTQKVSPDMLVPVTEPSGVSQRFVHTWRGNGIQYEEYVENAVLEFTVVTDHDFKKEQWGQLWLTGEKQGIGASRSQGFGTYQVVAWERS